MTKLKLVSSIEDEGCAIAVGTVATLPCGPSLLRVSALREGINYRAGPSERFLKLTRNPDLEPPARFRATVKGIGDVVI